MSSAALSVVRAPLEPPGASAPGPAPGAPAAFNLRVPQALAADWGALVPAVRRYLTSYLGPAPCLTADCPDRVELAGPPAQPVPAPFAEDLARGGRQLRAALPGLVRTVARIDAAAEHCTIEIACEGTHDAPFFGFLLPTRRRVRFAEQHRFTLGDHLLEDRVSIDVRAIVRQLASGRPA